MNDIGASIFACAVDMLARDSAYAAIVCVFVVVVSNALRDRAPAVHLGLWSLVFVRLVLPPDLSHPLAIGELLPRFASWIADHEASAGADGVGVLAVLQPLGTTDQAGAAGRRVPGWVTWWVAAWGVGVAAAASSHARRVRRVRRLLAMSEDCHDDAVIELVQRWRGRLGIRRTVRLVTADSEVVPFTVGILRPVVFVPRGMLGDRRFLEPAVAHELAHVACWHAFWLSLQHAIQAVYWFHPAAWFAGIRVAHERERLCDALVLSHGSFSAPR